MHIRDVQAYTNHLAAQRDFYHGQLGLPLLMETEQQCRIQIGASSLTWMATLAPLAGPYHFAFNIPENQLAAGMEWVEQISPVLSKDGQQQFHFAAWNADAAYFRDADGNILEIIARHSLANAATTTFGSQSLLNISEVGLPNGDVLALADALTARIGIAPWLGRDANFTTMGDENGLFILVPTGRNWLPTAQPALPLPLTITVQTGVAGEAHWPDLPYHIVAE
jgi:catechol 2,3-dioxygenase-like lactoylglutathione lyase family enzyme